MKIIEKFRNLKVAAKRVFVGLLVLSLVCTATGVGSIFAYADEDEHDHSYSDGSCTICGAADPNYSEPTGDPEPTIDPEPTGDPEPTSNPESLGSTGSGASEGGNITGNTTEGTETGNTTGNTTEGTGTGSTNGNTTESNTTGTPVTHEKHDYVYAPNNDGTHGITCSGCDYQGSEACTFGEWVDDEGGVTHTKSCTACGYKVTENKTASSDHEHSYGEWTFDGFDSHYKECSECHDKVYEKCVLSEISRNDSETHYKACPACGRREVEAHDLEYVQGDEAGTHYKRCTICGYVTEPEECTYEDGICIHCGASNPNVAPATRGLMLFSRKIALTPSFEECFEYAENMPEMATGLVYTGDSLKNSLFVKYGTPKSSITFNDMNYTLVTDGTMGGSGVSIDNDDDFCTGAGTRTYTLSITYAAPEGETQNPTLKVTNDYTITISPAEFTETTISFSPAGNLYYADIEAGKSISDYASQTYGLSFNGKSLVPGTDYTVSAADIANPECGEIIDVTFSSSGSNFKSGSIVKKVEVADVAVKLNGAAFNPDSVYYGEIALTADTGYSISLNANEGFSGSVNYVKDMTGVTGDYVASDITVYLRKDSTGKIISKTISGVKIGNLMLTVLYDDSSAMKDYYLGSVTLSAKATAKNGNTDVDYTVTIAKTKGAAGAAASITHDTIGSNQNFELYCYITIGTTTIEKIVKIENLTIVQDTDLNIKYNGSERKNWYNEDVTITCEGYKIATTSTGEYKSEYVFTESGKKDLFFKANNATTNPTSAITISVSIDKKIPTGSISAGDIYSTAFNTSDSGGYYTKNSVTAYISSADSESGIESAYYYVDNKFYSSDSELIGAMSDGNKNWRNYTAGTGIVLNQNDASYIYVKLEDKAGNVAYLSTQKIINDSKNPSITTATVEKSSKGIALNATGTDDLSGVAYFSVSYAEKKSGMATPSKDDVYKDGWTLSGEAQSDGSSKLSFIPSDVDLQKIYVFYIVAIDKAGNISEVFTKDGTTEKDITILYNGSLDKEDFYFDQVIITADGYKIATKADGPFSGNYVHTTKGPDQEIKLFFRDAQDTNAPVIEKIIDDINIYESVELKLKFNGEDLVGWYKGDVVLTCDNYQISEKSGSGFEKSYTFTGSGTITKDLYFKNMKAGTEGELVNDGKPYTITVKIDRVAPIGAISYLDYKSDTFKGKDSVAFYINESKNIAVSSSDELSGVASVHYYASDKLYGSANDLNSAITDEKSSWRTYTSGSNMTLTENKANYVYVRILDNAGNAKYISTEKIIYDNTAPVLSTITVSAASSGGGTQVAMAGTDALSGINRFKLMYTEKPSSGSAHVPTKEEIFNNGIYVETSMSDSGTYGATYTLTGLDSTKTYIFYGAAVDRAGNISEVRSYEGTTSGASSSGSSSSASSSSGAAASSGAASSGLAPAPSGIAGSGNAAGSGAKGGNGTGSSSQGTGSTSSSTSSPLDREIIRQPYIIDATGSTKIGLAATGGWNNIVSELKKADYDATIDVEMSGLSTIPASIFAAMKGKPVTTIFRMPQDAEWIIKGENITGDNVYDLDLGVKIGSRNIPSSDLENVTGTNPHYEFEIAHEGPFGFTASLVFPVGTSYAGLYANLYHYEEKEKDFKLEGTTIITPEGTAVFDIDHASSYTVVITSIPLLTEKTEVVVSGEQSLTDSETLASTDALLRIPDLFGLKGRVRLYLILIGIISAALCVMILFLPGLQLPKRKEADIFDSFL